MARKIEKGTAQPCDALIEALRQFVPDQSYIEAEREARQIVNTLGAHQQMQVVNALWDPLTRKARNPIGFAVAAVRDRGGVQPYRIREVAR